MTREERIVRRLQLGAVLFAAIMCVALVAYYLHVSAGCTDGRVFRDALGRFVCVRGAR